MGGSFSYGILGPLEVTRDGRVLPLGGARQRAVLARLLVDAGRVVALDALIEDVWDGRPPATAAKTLQKYVSELRKVLGPAVLQTASGGYRLEVAADALDAARFERLVASGDIDGALALWRGVVLADLPDVQFAIPERSRLHELRSVALERKLDADIVAGRHAEAVGPLAALVQEEPLRDKLCGLLMLALYRSGRQVEALRAFDTHRRLMAEVGLEPAPHLRALEAAILEQDAGLDPVAPASDRQPKGNVPLSLTTFIGRQAEVAVALRSVAGNRLVTLTGPGGVGKTRLALEVGRRASDGYPAGAWLVDLAGVADPGLVAHTVAVTLGLGDQRGQEDRETVVAALRSWPATVLVLDNCEHLIEACADLVDRVLRSSAGVRVLATSRHPLGVDGEFVLPVGPLATSDAVRLFTERARFAGTALADNTDHEVVAEICQALDGLPLAIELAASQLRVLGPREIAARLDDRLQFRGRRLDAPARQRTLGDMVRWSHELLPAATRRVFARLSVFATTLTLEAAEAVCGEGDALEHMTTLVDHSLLAAEPGPAGEMRYRLLDTLRLFALEQLARQGDLSETKRAHACHFEGLARAAGPHLYGPDEVPWAARLAVEEPNFHVALAWAREHDAHLALRLAVALWPYWDLRWRERFAVEYLEAVLRYDGFAPLERGRGLAMLAEMAANPGEARRARVWAEEAVAILRACGDQQALAAALVAFGSASGNGGALDRAEAAIDEAVRIARARGDEVLVGRCLNYVSFVASRRGDHVLEERICQDELACWVAVGSRRGEATALRHLAVANRYLGRFERAIEQCNRALALWQQMDDQVSAAHVRTTLADIARVQGDLDQAAALYQEALAELQAIGDKRCTASTFKNLGLISTERGDHEHAADLFLDAMRVRHELGDEAGLAECLEGLAVPLVAGGRVEETAVLLGAAERFRETSGAALPDDELATIAHTAAQARVVLGDDGFTRAHRVGGRMTGDDAVAYARDASRPAVPVSPR